MSQNLSQNIIAIPAGVELGKYRIVRTLGQGGFGMTYLAEDIATGEKVVIKENLPTFCACRNTTSLTVTATNPDDELQEYNKLLTRFVEEARLLAQLDHPNIVKVLGAFEALGTAYYVMPWVGGQELQKVAPAPADITEEWLLPILRTMLGALGYLHSRNIYHRDVKPANILLTDAGAPILIDFGTARAIISDRSATLVGSPGYSPIEQITTHGKRGPWTDLYSLGATCYRLITGNRPPEANERLAEDEDPLRPLAPRADLRGRFSPAFLATIDKALTLRAKGRWQTVNEWLAALAGSTHEEPSSRSIPTSPIEVKMAPQPSPAPRRKGAFVVLFCVLLLGSMGTGGYLLYKHGQTIAEQRLRDEQTAREEAERKAREEAERKAREEAERKAREEAERKAREEAERKAREEAERKAREEAERKAREEAERIAREEAERIRQAEADYVMGDNYYFGNNGYSVNYNKAVEYYRKAAEQGHANAQCDLGYCYDNGQGINKDLNEAVQWYRKAAEQGHATAQFNLGLCYRDGRGVTRDYYEASQWFSKAAEQGYAEAQCALGYCYDSGQGVSRDYNEAVRWFRKAAEQGYAMAQLNLGLSYKKGQGVSRDYNEAVSWFRKAAEQGYASAQCNLGWCYDTGKGVSRNRREAVYWYRKAAQQGEPTAQTNLRRMGETW